jgi:hypothetical protein
MARMRSALALVFLVACGDGGGDDEGVPDADVAPGETCSPAATEAPPPIGSGPAPVGRFDVEWRCADGCTDGAPLVIMQGSSVDIGSDGVARWIVDNAPLYPISFTLQDGCWVRRPSLNGCHSAIVICTVNGRPRIDRLYVRSLLDGHEEAWEMR